MHVVLFYHSLVSDWNHGNAHFLRGIAGELLSRGHCVTVYEPEDSWSRLNLCREYGDAPLRDFRRAYPMLSSRQYRSDDLDLDAVLDTADLVIVHEWNEADLVVRLGAHRARSDHYRLLFHDTHHRSVTDPAAMARYDLSHYDGVLAFGRVIRDLYLRRGWVRRAWTWHEAADTHIFRPLSESELEGDLVWIGNWGDGERTRELEEYLLGPVKALGLKARVYGVRYPEHALEALDKAGIEYGGWLPNYRVPEVYARYRVTIHVPRRPYVQALPGIPTIRVFEALACGIPLVCSPWRDSEGLFQPGRDFIIARNGAEMRRHLDRLLSDESFARVMARHGQATVRTRHTCAHRVDDLVSICGRLGLDIDPGPGGEAMARLRAGEVLVDG